MKIPNNYVKIYKKTTNVRYLILLFMVAVYPLIIVPTPINYSVFPRFIILIALSLLALYSLIREQVDIRHPVLIPLGIFFVFMLISTIFAIDPMTALVGTPNRLTGLITYTCCFILFIVAMNNDDNERLLKYMIGTATIVSILAVLQYFGINLVPENPEVTFNNKGHGTIGNPNFLGTYTAFILPAAVIYYLVKKRPIFLLSTGLIYAGLLVCLTRGTWLAAFVTFIILCVYFLRAPEMRVPFAKVVILLALISAVLFPAKDGLILERAFSISTEVKSTAKLEDDAGSGRMDIWKKSAKLVPGYWLTGMGADNLAQAEMYTPSGKLIDKTHNIYLEILVTMGIFTLIAFLFLLFYIMSHWKHRETSFLFFTMVFTYLVQGFFNIDVVPVLPLFWITLGISIKSAG